MTLRVIASLWLVAVLVIGNSTFAEEPDAAVDTSALISASAEGAKVYFISPVDGATLPEIFKVKFGLAGMGVAPAGVDFENSGHHHLLIDLDEMPDMRLPLPADEQHVHFGLGQTETEVTLSPGEHKLRLVLGNYLHIPHDPPIVSKVITITTK